MILDPKLFISKEAEDIEWQVKMANLLSGEDSSKEEMLKVLMQIQFIVAIYQKLGITYSESKIRFINKSLQLKIKENNRLVEKINSGMFVSQQVASNLEPIEFYNRMLNNVEVKYFKIILKKMGKRNFEKVFGNDLLEVNSNVYERVMNKIPQGYAYNHS